MPATVLRFPTTRRLEFARSASLADLVSEADLLSDFFSGFSPATVRTYRQQITAFATWVGCELEALPALLFSTGPGPATQLVARYRGALLERGAAPATINIAIVAIRSLVGTARACRYIDWSIDVRGVRSEAYRDTRGPGLEAIRALLATAAAHRSPRLAARNIAIVRLLFDLALRCHELTTLDMAHVEIASSAVPEAIHVLGKGYRARQRIVLTSASAEALANWMRTRGKAPGSLFGLRDRGVAKLLGRLSDSAGVGHVHPHGIRHTSVTAALDATNGDVRLVRAFSRHAKVETVLRYNDQRLGTARRVAGAVSDQI